MNERSSMLYFTYLFLATCAPVTPYQSPLPRKYFSNKFPYKDLNKVDASQASFISKQWMDSIIKEIQQKYENQDEYISQYLPGELMNLSDNHIIHSINTLEEYITEHRSQNDIYLIWMPATEKKVKTPLFIVVGEFNPTNQEFNIKHLVQSPSWDPAQIESNELKLCLESYTTKKLNADHINLEFLYEHDLRYKLAWVTWMLESPSSPSQ